jgi:hypothetical protein
LWTQIPNSKKNDKVFSLFSGLFAVGQKKYFANFFRWTNGIFKKEMWLICVFTVSDTKNFLKFQTVDKNENAPNIRIGDSWA